MHFHFKMITSDAHLWTADAHKWPWPDISLWSVPITIITSKAAHVTLKVRHKGNKSMVTGSSGIKISCK